MTVLFAWKFHPQTLILPSKKSPENKSHSNCASLKTLFWSRAGVILNQSSVVGIKAARLLNEVPICSVQRGKRLWLPMNSALLFTRSDGLRSCWALSPSHQNAKHNCGGEKELSMSFFLATHSVHRLHLLNVLHGGVQKQVQTLTSGHF